MKKTISVIMMILFLIMISSVSVSAEETNFLYDLSSVYESLSEEAKESLHNIGAESADPNILSEISFSSIVAEILNIASDNIASPLKGLITIISLILLCSILSAYKNTLSNDVSNAINIVSALCITSSVAMPAISVIKSAGTVIEVSSNLMLAYIPIMVVIMSTSGYAVSGASYYTIMIAAGEGIGQLASKVIVPLLNMFLGISITTSVSPDINLSGFTNIISKVIKWILGFAMAIFTSLLTFKQLISTSLDTISTRAVKFTLSSFIPIVGSALSEAYKTVQGSVGLLKTGSGIFVILSVVIVFLPIIMQSLMWILTLWVGKSTAEVLSLLQTAKLLESVTTVFSTLVAVMLCIMSVYIISTALVLVMGGGVG